MGQIMLCDGPWCGNPPGSGDAYPESSIVYMPMTVKPGPTREQKNARHAVPSAEPIPSPERFARDARIRPSRPHRMDPRSNPRDGRYFATCWD